MAGLNHGYKFTYSADVRKSKEKTLMNSEGVHYSTISKKWVVRMPNNTTSVNVKPFISVAQFDDKNDAESKYNEILTTKNK